MPISTRFQIDGMDQLLHALSRVMAADVRQEPMVALKERLITRLATYPPPPPNSSYVRTGDLGRGWAEEGSVAVDAVGTNQFADRVSITLENKVPYSGWVQGPEQVAIHQGRWETAQEALDAESAPFVDELRDSIAYAWASSI